MSGHEDDAVSSTVALRTEPGSTGDPIRHRSSSSASSSVAVIAIAIGIAGLVLAVIATTTSLDWIGRSFPGFVILPNRLIATISLPHWSGASIPNVYMSRVVTVDGEPVANVQAIETRIAAKLPGTTTEFEIEHGDTRRTVVAAVQTFGRYDWAMLFGAYLLNGVVFLGSGLLAWYLRPRSALSRAFLAFAVNSALFLFTALDLYGPGRLFHLHLASEALLPATLLQLTMLFPYEHPLARWRFAGYPVAALLLASWEVNVDRPALFVPSFQACMVLSAAIGLWLGARCIAQFRSASSPLARQRVRVATLATVAGISVPGVIFLASLALGARIGMNTIAFTFFVFPAGLAYAIVKHDFLAIDSMVKRGAYYLVLTSSVGLGYALAVFVLDRVTHGSSIAQTPGFAALFAIAMLLLVNPLRARLQSAIDRLFFRATYDPAKALSEVGGRLGSALEHREIGRLVREGIQSVIPNSGTRVLLAVDEGSPIRDVDDARELLEVFVTPLEADRVLTSEDPPEAYSSPDQHRAVRAALQELGATIMVPMRLRGRLVGAIAIGAKKSGLFFTGGDAEFLRALAHQGAIAASNATAFQAIARRNEEELDRARRTAIAPLLLPSKFEILGKIGQGGMGIVFKARHLALDAVVAVKVLPEHLANDQHLVERFQREARVMAQLRHPNIVQVMDVDCAGPVKYFVMEYIAGATLADVLLAEGALPGRRAVDIALQVAAALEHAHDDRFPVIHRDISPANILIEEGTGRVVVTDFGIAKTLAQEGLTTTGDFMGKVRYAAPEQLRGDGNIDGRADVYALGVVLYEMVTGWPFFAGLDDVGIVQRVLHHPDEFEPRFLRAVPPGLRPIVIKATTRDRERRYDRIATLRDALTSVDDVVQGESGPSTEPPHGDERRARAGAGSPLPPTVRR